MLQSAAPLSGLLSPQSPSIDRKYLQSAIAILKRSEIRNAA
jgi:hypothetical protein